MTGIAETVLPGPVPRPGAVDLRIPDSDRYRARTKRDLPAIGRRFGLASGMVDDIATVAEVLPFRVNDYVLERLIDWDAVPDDPMFRLVFPQPEMLDGAARDAVRAARAAVAHGAAAEAHLREVVDRIRADLNPHPDGQLDRNVPVHRGAPLAGVQHKYSQTVLTFPSSGQTCHAYCTYCFRWAQFVGDRSLRFAARTADPVVEYLVDHPEVTDVLVTGGDPMVMSAARLRTHIEPMLAVRSVETIRIGTKSVGYWPQRFLTDPDAEETLAFLREIVDTGRTLALMLHFTLPREVQTPEAKQALAALRATGARLYGQAPIVAEVNDDVATWSELWRAEHGAGVVPYYMFVERDTGPREYFQVPLVRAQRVFAETYRTLPGLARTVRGPVMSCTPGKLLVDGVLGLGGRSWMSLRFVQARDASLVDRPFLAEARDDAYWADDLVLHPDTPADLAAAVREA